MGDVELRLRYCCSVPGLLKWLAIVFSAVVVGLLCWEGIRNESRRFDDRLHDGELYTVIVGFFTIAVIFLLLLSFFLNCHNSLCAGCRCRTLASWIYLLCLCLWVAAAGVQVWVTTELKKGYYGGNTDYANRRAASAAFCFANVLVFVFALQQARYVEI